MRLCKFLVYAIALASAGLLLSSCTVIVPAHPAHGYRHVHHGVAMVYDSGLGLYIVTGHPDVYFYSGHYYRYYDGGWRISVNVGGPWSPHRFESVPLRLRERYGPPGGPPGGRGPGRGDVGGPPGRGRGDEGPGGRGRGRGRGPG